MHTILVVEDDQRVAQLLQAGLEECGYGVLVAFDGVMGVRLFKESKVGLYPMSYCPKWMVLKCVRK